MKLHVSLMLVANPKNVVLIGVEPRERQALEIVHHLLLLFFGRCILSGECNHAAGVFVFVVAVVDQRPSCVRVAPQNLGRRAPVPPLSIYPNIVTDEVFSRTTPTTTTAREKFNQHRRPPPCACAVQVSVRPE